MRRNILWLLSTASALILLFGYHTSTSSKASTSVHANVNSGLAKASSGTSVVSGTSVTGDVVSTRWGDVQVQITVSGGKIVTSEATQVPWNNNRDQQINSYAVPIYNQESVAQQSAKIDMVSGATVTYNGYVASLQSAIDKANL